MKTHQHDCIDSPARNRGGGDRAARLLGTREWRSSEPVRRAQGNDAHTTLDHMPNRSSAVTLVAQGIVGCIVVSAIGNLVEAETLGARAPSFSSFDRDVAAPLNAG